MRKTKNRKISKTTIILILLLIVLFSVANSLLAYWYLRTDFIERDTQAYKNHVSLVANQMSLESNPEFLSNNAQFFGEKVLAETQTDSISIYDPNRKLWWTSEKTDDLGFNDNVTSSVVVLDDFYRFKQQQNFINFTKLFNISHNQYQTFLPIVNKNGDLIVIVKTTLDYGKTIRSALYIAVYLLGLLLFSLIAVIALSYRFLGRYRNTQTVVHNKDIDLSEKVLKLSNVINNNKLLQRSMKSASGRAVELNERFLRKVGADLHDGPAQSIGYALLKLNQIKSKPIAKELGHEFPGIIESLDDSLNEIRGISSGLVLPELEQMTLEEAIHKVVDRHISNTETEVSEVYTNLPNEVALPIKICAYRLVQEGLNNAYRHGRADKCRFLAQVNGSTLTLILKDNGSGFRKSTLNTDGGHLGLAGLQDRIESLGGTIAIKSELGVGTSIKVSIELPEEDTDINRGHSVTSIIH